MSGLVLFLCIGLLVSSVVEGAPNSCGRHGDSCVSSSQCCPSLKCHRYAQKCQVQITEEDLMAQREKILGRKGKDYK